MGIARGGQGQRAKKGGASARPAELPKSRTGWEQEPRSLAPPLWSLNDPHLVSGKVRPHPGGQM
jgi:hypothetical protein